jgi:hypothetical protein
MPERAGVFLNNGLVRLETEGSLSWECLGLRPLHGIMCARHNACSMKTCEMLNEKSEQRSVILDEET